MSESIYLHQLGQACLQTFTGHLGLQHGFVKR